MSVSSKQKVLCVLYDDPVDGYPGQYPRSGIPTLKQYPGGQSLPSPDAIDFNPGALLGSISGELGLRKFLTDRGHQFVVTSDKDGQTRLSRRSWSMRTWSYPSPSGPRISPPRGSQNLQISNLPSRPVLDRTTWTSKLPSIGI